jgi:hypothetical protein
MIIRAQRGVCRGWMMERFLGYSYLLVSTRYFYSFILVGKLLTVTEKKLCR